jgi:hypothetical protein
MAARAVVTATGMTTEVGRIAGMLRKTPAERTPLQRQLDRTGRQLGAVAVAIAVVMAATLLLVEDVRGASAILVVLLVIPKGTFQHHVRTLAGIARLAMNQEVRERITLARDPKEIVETIATLESLTGLTF